MQEAEYRGSVSLDPGERSRAGRFLKVVRACRPLTGGVALVAVTAALVMLLFVVSGDTKSSDAEAHGFPTNGCSIVRDTGAWFNFHNSCDYHDRCLYYHWATKSKCDYNFYLKMRSYCLNTYPWWHPYRGPCLHTASSYYFGVKYLSGVCRLIPC